MVAACGQPIAARTNAAVKADRRQSEVARDALKQTIGLHATVLARLELEINGRGAPRLPRHLALTPAYLYRRVVHATPQRVVVAPELELRTGDALLRNVRGHRIAGHAENELVVGGRHHHIPADRRGSLGRAGLRARRRRDR